VARALDEYLENSAANALDVEDRSHGSGYRPESEQASEQLELAIVDLCTECGHAALVNEEGCRKCYACGYSEC
jgi:ribonucleoside-diphosphate reductase alpha chain